MCKVIPFNNKDNKPTPAEALIMLDRVIEALKPEPPKKPLILLK